MPARIAANRRHLDEMLDVAESYLTHEAFDACASALQAAGFHGWRNHPGIYHSPRLEKMAHVLGESVPRSSTLQSRSGVLHVLTEASQVGGHTRLAWRWMNADRRRRHDVVLTNQRGARIPADLARAVDRAGGRLTDLSETHRGLMARAAALAALADGAEVVIVHSHPHDVVPTVALSGSSSPVGLLNHADHVFWTGVSVADAVINLRVSGHELSARQRGVEAGANLMLPLPLDPAGATRGGDEARQEWDVPDGAQLAVTIASPYKFNAPRGTDYVGLHEELLRRSPNLHVRVAGPHDSGAWREAAERTSGRLRAIGPVRDIVKLYDAADLYLDSFPMGSLTSLLDAASRGVPAVSFSGIATPHVMTSDDPSLSSFDVFFSDQDAYLSRVQTLLADQPHREDLGATMAREVARMHTVEWPTLLDRVYEVLGPAAEHRSPGRAPSPRPEQTDAADGDVQDLLIRVHDGSGMSVPVWAAWMHEAPHAPMRTRLAWLRRVPLRSWPSVLPQLVPDVSTAFARSRLRRLRELGTLIVRVRPR